MAAVLTQPQESRRNSIAATVRFVAGVMLLLAATFYFWNKPQVAAASPYWGWFGALAVALLWLIGGTLANNWNPLSYAMGADNRLSTSKFQILLWTAAVGFVYVMYYADRLKFRPDSTPIADIPTNVLIALGISVTTTVAAQAIAGSQANANPGTKGMLQQPSYDPAALVRNDDATAPSLTKIQVLFWTVIAITVFLASAFQTLGLVYSRACTPVDPCFPDISPILMIFMGLGHASYLGGKLASGSQPSLSKIQSTASTTTVTGRSITISGTNLGSAPGSITMAGAGFTPSGLTWAPTAITFDLPPKADGSPWSAGDTAPFVVNVNGAASSPIAYTYP